MYKAINQVLLLILVFFSSLIIGCSTTFSEPVIKDLEDDKVIVRYQYDGTFVLAPPQEDIELEAQRGCKLHGKIATAISKSCVEDLYSGIVCDHLFACLAE